MADKSVYEENALKSKHDASHGKFRDRLTLILKINSAFLEVQHKFRFGVARLQRNAQLGWDSSYPIFRKSVLSVLMPVI